MRETRTGSAGLGALLRAALPSVPGLHLVPGVRKGAVADFGGLQRRREPVQVTADQVAGYRRVCRFATTDHLPVSYPHLLAFGLHLDMMSDRRFPVPAIGTVHVANTFTSHRPIRYGETLEVLADVGPAIPHPKGISFEFGTSVRSAGELVWEGTSTYLRRQVDRAGGTIRSAPDESRTPAVHPAAVGTGAGAGTGISWSLPADLGRRYAAVSGDLNPIHLHPLTARAFGFPRQIAHGMCTLALCLAAIENRLPAAVRVDVEFRRPVLLPATATFSTGTTPEGRVFRLTRPDGVPHLIGTVRASAAA